MQKKWWNAGCMPAMLISAITFIATGTWLMDSWDSLPGIGKAFAIALIAFGVLTLLPFLIWLILKIWLWRLKKSLTSELNSLVGDFGKYADNNRSLYGQPHQFREADENDLAAIETSFYHDSEQILLNRSFRKLGDIVDATIEALDKPSPVIRVMVSHDGTSSVGIYHLKFGETSIYTIDIESEFSDGTYLVTANTAGFDLTTPPPQIERRQFEQSTDIASLVDSHNAELANLLAQRVGCRCVEMHTLDDALEMQKRLHAVKSAAMQQNNFVDPGTMQHVTEEIFKSAKTSANGPDTDK